MTISMDLSTNCNQKGALETMIEAAKASASEAEDETPIVNLEKIDLDESSPKPKHDHDRNRHRHKHAQDELSQNVHKRMASLTESEQLFLKALLIDNNETEPPEEVTSEASFSFSHGKETDEELRVKLLRQTSAKLNDEMLFSVPKQIDDYFAVSGNKNSSNKSKTIPTPKRKSNHGLWLAHRDGVHPRTLISLAKSLFRKDGTDGEPFLREHDQPQQESNPKQMSDTQAPGGLQQKHRNKSSLSNGSDRRSSDAHAPHSLSSSLRKKELTSLQRKSQTPRRVLSSGSATSGVSYADEDDDDDIPSDEEVRPELDNCKPADDDSSWDSRWDANHREYDAWEVLKDEYAADFGFNFTQPGASRADDDVPPDSFQILGTSPDDPECSPHVMSPPMLDALMSFLPENLLGQNFWLRFSLVRDGASLHTLKRYVRASQYTILAIETPSGQVFGSFTSSPWKNTYGFYGSTPAFVWKMRHSRQTSCSSLFEQAQLESEIDVFMAEGFHDRIQVCRHDTLAVGGDEDVQLTDDEAKSTIDDDDNQNRGSSISSISSSNRASASGFAIALEEDLLRGTTSHCRTFHNPALCGDGSQTQVFDVAGLEVWTLTPCFDVKAAEKLEMTKFFIEEESMRSIRTFPDSPSMGSRRGSSFSASEAFDQEQFYRRLGRDPDSEARRDRWQYLNTMNGFIGDRRGLGASPRFR